MRTVNQSSEFACRIIHEVARENTAARQDLQARVDALEAAIREAHDSHTVEFMSARTGLVIDPPRPIEKCSEGICEALTHRTDGQSS